MVGPGQYNLSHAQKVGVKSWKEDKTVKLPAFPTNPNVGPGSYEIRDGIPLYNYKPTGSFISNTVRTIEPKKPAPFQKNINYTDRVKLTS